jgi:hypothetical protein
MARPAGEVRQAILKAAEGMCQKRGYTWRELAAAAQVGWSEARVCCENLERAGVLIYRLGKVMGCSRPQRFYSLVAAEQQGSVPLSLVVAVWVGHPEICHA